MIEFAMAASHAPVTIEPVAKWADIYAAVPPSTVQSQPASAKEETPERLAEYRRRIETAQGTLRDALHDCDPDVILILGDDEGDVFDSANMPTFYLYTGDEAWGREGTGYQDLADRAERKFRCNGAFGADLLSWLIRHGFDLSTGSSFVPRGHNGVGISHMVAHLMPVLDPDGRFPIVPLYINEYFPPLPTAARCIELGRAIRRFLDGRPERVALIASGGLSHDPFGPRAGWIDEPLDRWVLDRLARNEVDELEHLFAFDSDTLRGGTGEIRAWIAVAAAMDRPATVLDYIPIHHGKTGVGYAIWPPDNGTATETRSDSTHDR